MFRLPNGPLQTRRVPAIQGLRVHVNEPTRTLLSAFAADQDWWQGDERNGEQ